MTTTDPAARRILFLDVDGTLLDHGSIVAPSTVAAVRAARAAGHLVYLCTGRAAGDIHPAVRAIGVDGEVTNGGAYAVDGSELILSRPMPRADVERLLAVFEEHDLGYFLQSHDEVFASPRIAQTIAEYLASRRALVAEERTRLGLTVDDPDETAATPRHRPLAEADLDAIAKGVFISSVDGAVEAVREALGERFLVIPGSMPMPSGSNGEVSMAGTDKGSGIRAVLAHRGLDAADAIGIGDSWNDREMFDVVGTSVVMGQADPELQRHADLVTTSVAEDGVATALARLGLIDPA